MAYNYKFMDEAKLKEIEELLAGEKGNALVAWSLECAKAGIDGCIDGYRNGLIKGGLIAAAGAVVAASGYWIAKKVAKKHVEKRLEEAAKKET